MSFLLCELLKHIDFFNALVYNHNSCTLNVFAPNPIERGNHGGADYWRKGNSWHLRQDSRNRKELAWKRRQIRRIV